MRRRRLLHTTLGLVAPVLLLVACVVTIVQDRWVAIYAAAAIVACVVLLAPPLLAGLPERVRVWQVGCILALQAVPLWMALGAATSGSPLGLLALAGFAYAPVVAIARLVVQQKAATSPDLPRESSTRRGWDDSLVEGPRCSS